MEDAARFLITLGSLMLLGLATDAVGRLTHLPRVTLLLAFGVCIGPEGFDLLPLNGAQWFALSAHAALVMVGFLLGERFGRATLREHGRHVIWISVTAVVVTAGGVALGLWAIGAPLGLALLLGAISTSTDPAATADVVAENEIQSSFSRILLGVVALDDAWGLIYFGFTLAVVGMLTGGSAPLNAVLEICREVGGALALGFALGLPLARLTGRIQAGEPTLLEALGVVFLCGGLALWLGVSPLLAAMALGATVANLARHHTRPFHAIEGIERPFLILFFVFAGAALRIDALQAIGWLGAGYILTRGLGRVAGGYLGGVLSSAPTPIRDWMGLALMPQAGVALGLALVASQRFPEWGDEILPLVIGTTVVFELLGPVCTDWALRRTSS